MKKLMIAAAIVCAAAMSQAATCYWNCNNYTGSTIKEAGGASAISSGTLYLFWAEGVASTVTQQDVIDNAKDIATLGAAKTFEVTNGTWSDSWSDTLNTSDPYSEVTRKYFVALVDGDNVFVSNSASAKETTDPTGRTLAPNLTTPSSAAVKAAGTKFATGKAGWYSTVPEPTSGLLLLLGMAGLALKRKRA